MRARRGYALVAVIACLTVIEIAVLAVLLVCGAARVRANESLEQARARLAAESAVRVAVAGWDEAALPVSAAEFAVPWATGGLPGGTQYDARAERVSRGLYLVRGSGIVGAGALRARAVASARLTVIPQDVLWRDFQAALTAAADITVISAATIDGSNAAVPAPPWRSSDCPPPGYAPAWYPGGAARPAIALGPAGVLLSGAASLIGAPAVLTGAAGAGAVDFTQLGGLSFSDLATIADRIEAGSVGPAPSVAGGLCDTAAPGNWGAPDDPASPCFGFLPLIFAPGDLTITGGSGQGILVVGGRLTVAAGVQFRGAVLVAGAISAPAFELHGALRVGGAASRAGGTIIYDACALGRAFTLAPAFRRLYRPVLRWWLPAF